MTRPKYTPLSRAKCSNTPVALCYYFTVYPTPDTIGFALSKFIRHPASQATSSVNVLTNIEWWTTLATPKPSHNKPSHPHVPSWAIFLSEGFRASIRAIPSQEPATLILKRRMGVRGSTQGPPLGGQIPPKLTSDRPAFI